MEHAHHIPTTSYLKRRTPWNTLSARVISLVSRKGGVGKTTSAINLGAAFALSGHTVLIIGVDPQCGVARILGGGTASNAGGLLDLWDHDQTLTDLAQTSPLKELCFVSSRIGDINAEERYLSLLQERTDVFVQQVDRARNLYDTIIIDCPPHLGPPTRAALQASDSILVPVQAEELCRDSLGALLGALDTFNEARGGEALAGPELEGIFLTMLSEKTRMGRHVAARVAEEFGPVMFETAVPRTTRLSEMALRGKPSVIYDRRSPGSRAYFNLADEILRRYREREGLTDDDDDEHEGPHVHKNAANGSRAHQRPGAVDPGSRDGIFSLVGGLDRLLGDLRANGQLELPSAPQAEELANPDMVSLDDLLAEEEAGYRDSWSESWSDDEGHERRLN
jgi:chromosome partitioning protein